MERFDLAVVSMDDMRKCYANIRRALVCGIFMQIAHKEGSAKAPIYVTVKDNQCVLFHPSGGLGAGPEWVLFHEFVLTTAPYIRVVTEVKGEWLLEYAPEYFDVSTFPDGAAKRALQRIAGKRTGKINEVGAPGGTNLNIKKKKRRQMKKRQSNV